VRPMGRTPDIAVVGADGLVGGALAGALGDALVYGRPRDGEAHVRQRVIGWRERTIDLADRIAPGLYDRLVLRQRVRRVIG
jgi:hypothetical protein